MAETCVVACKLPGGLILRLTELVDQRVPSPTGFVVEKIPHEIPGTRFVLNRARVPPGVVPNYRIIGGYSLTPNCPLDLWRMWKAQNHDSDLLRAGLIFAFTKSAMAADAAREYEGERTGLEPLDVTRRFVRRHPQSDAPMYRPNDPRLDRDGLQTITTDDGTPGGDKFPGTTTVSF